MSPSCEGHRVMRVKLKAAYCPPSPLLFLLESDDIMLYDISCRNFFVRYFLKVVFSSYQATGPIIASCSTMPVSRIHIVFFSYG